jgi:hypothetical protein
MSRVVVLILLTHLCLAASAPPARAQASENYVAYVEAIVGPATTSLDATQGEIDVLDPIKDGTWLSVGPGAELRICHYATHRLLTLKGPLHAMVSSAGVTVESGRAVAASGENCVAPVISTVQGGVAMRGLWTTNVGLRPKIRVISRKTQQIRKAALLDDRKRPVATAFDRGAVVQPQLSEGRTYVFVIEFADGSEWRMILQAHAGAEASTVIVSVR